MAAEILHTNGSQTHLYVGIKPGYTFAETVVEVQVSGDELTYVTHHFNHLPQAPHTRVVRYFGDHAKFIVANW
jgi:hypothetical protein